jgi:pimeloyl-ACP methyl ester carboxylesterase
MRRFAVFGGLLALILAVLGAVGVLYLGQRMDERVVGSYFDSKGVRIHYTDEGQGEPVILIHGFAANADWNWRAPGVLGAIRDSGYRVIAPDMRGHGLSDKPETPEAYGGEMAEDIVRLMDHLGIAKAHVIGYSMGAFITLKLITLHPDRLLSASPGGAGWQKADSENVAKLMRLADSLDSGQGFGPLFEIISPEGKPPGWFFSMTTGRLLARANNVKALACVARGFRGLEVNEEALKKNTVPTLSIVGTIDPLRVGVDNMQGVMANLETVYVEGGDHITTLRDRAYLGAIQKFLAKHRQQDAPTQTVALRPAA